MNGKYYIGKRVSSFERLAEVGPITGIALVIDENNEYLAGDQDGYVLEVECPYGTQDMADNILAALQNQVYKGYDAADAILDPMAELGDGIDVNGMYSMLAYRSVEFGPGHFSDVSAPGENELEHEYPYQSPAARSVERKIAETNSRIIKTAEEIRLEVENELAGQSAEFSLQLSGLSTRFENELAGQSAEFSAGLEGLSFRLSGVEQKAAEDLANYAETVTASMKNLQSQIDGQIETFYYDYEPKLTNIPASEWTTEAERARHEGDLFYWKSKGYAYRFFKDGSTWKWQMVQDTDITAAMEQAAEAQDTADAKRRVFVSTPYPPYDVGDLWTQGTGGDIMRCKTARSSGSYVSTDWEKASKYTDDTTANTAITRISELNQTLDDITLNVQNLSTGLGQTLRVAADGVTITNAQGSRFRIDGGQIDAEKINVDDLQLTGAISWSDLDSDTQYRINNAGDSVPSYIRNTYISSVEIRSPEITGNNIRAYGYFQTYNEDNGFCGYIGAAQGATSAEITNGVAMSYGSPVSLGAGGHYVIVTERGVRLQSGSNSFYVVDDGIYYNGVDISEGKIAVFG